MSRPEEKTRNKGKLADKAPRTNKHFPLLICTAIMKIDCNPETDGDVQQPNGFREAICKAVSDLKDVGIFHNPSALSWIKNVQTGKWRLEDAESCMNSRPEAQAWRFA